MKIDKPLVAIHCLVYNHEPYLRDCFEGFVMQQTNFPFVAIVHDDASTDGSAAIIREYEEKYPHIFKPIYETENQYSKHDGSLERIMDESIDAIEAKYVAMCEGDDYWTDCLKLQKQVNFLENNLDFSMCFHAADVKNETNAPVIITCENIEEKEFFTDDIFPGWVVPTASVVYRKNMVDCFLPIKNAHWIKYGDIVLFLKCTHTGRIWGMSDRMSVYRMTESGAVVSQYLDSNSEEKKCKHYKFLIQNFSQINKKWVLEYIAQYHYTKFRNETKWNKKISALIEAINSAPRVVLNKACNAIRKRCF